MRILKVVLISPADVLTRRKENVAAGCSALNRTSSSSPPPPPPRLRERCRREQKIVKPEDEEVCYEAVSSGRGRTEVI